MSNSNVTLEIAGRRYTIACAAGQEQHVEGLGASIDSKLAQLDNLHGQSPERILLYASLLLADELHEASSVKTDDPQAESLEKMAEQLEGLAQRLESGATSA